MNSLRILQAGDPEWSEWLALAPHDFYHSSAYHSFSEEQGEGRAFLAVYGSRDRFIAWPYLLRDVSFDSAQTGYTDITSVYGYGGPVCRGCEPHDEFVGQGAHAIEDAWREQKVVATFSRLHPVLENHHWVQDSSCLLGHGHTIALDLSLAGEELQRSYNRKLRQELRYAREGGVKTFIDEDWLHFEDFLRLYHHTMSRNYAGSGYFFSEDYFRQFRRALAPDAVLMVAAVGQKIVAACIFVEYGDRIAAHLEGADEDYLSVSPFKVMVDDERARGHAAGRKWLHLGGGRGGKEDSLFTVKRRFSPLQFPFYTFRKVLQQTVYDDLIQARRRQAEELGVPFEPDGFFPAYRANIHTKLIGAAL